VGLLDPDVFARLLLILSDESGIQLRIEFARWIVREIQQPNFRIGADTPIGRRKHLATAAACRTPQVGNCFMLSSQLGLHCRLCEYDALPAHRYCELQELKRHFNRAWSVRVGVSRGLELSWHAGCIACRVRYVVDNSFVIRTYPKKHQRRRLKNALSGSSRGSGNVWNGCVCASPGAEHLRR
jgi:hypothetical protein